MKPEQIRQCKTCPWKVGSSTNKIPQYDRAKHEALRSSMDQPVSATIRVMSCHYTTPRDQRPCAGWLHQQYETGNAMVQISVRLGRLPSPIIRGPQRKTFADTFVNDADLVAMEAHDPVAAKVERANRRTLRPLLSFMLPPDVAILKAGLAAAQERDRVKLQAHASPPYCGKCKRPHPMAYPFKGRPRDWHAVGDAQMSRQQLDARRTFEEAFNAEIERQQVAQ